MIRNSFSPSAGRPAHLAASANPDTAPFVYPNLFQGLFVRFSFGTPDGVSDADVHIRCRNPVCPIRRETTVSDVQSSMPISKV